MATKKKLQVFVSSTYEDMKEERQAAVEAILRAGHIPAGMELFAAGSESQLDVIRRWIDDSDVFMLILGGRYGSIEPKSKKSYIELEYAHATAKGMPYFAAVAKDGYIEEKVKRSGSAVIETENGPKFKVFKNEVTGKICRMFEDVRDLKICVFESLGEFASNEKLIGWIRSNEAIDPKSTLEEMERLRTEVATLRATLDEIKAIPAVELSDNAKRLFLSAADGDGRILISYYNSGTNISAGREKTVVQYGSRDLAEWKFDIQQLTDGGLIEIDSQTEHNTIYSITKRGYDISDEMRS